MEEPGVISESQVKETLVESALGRIMTTVLPRRVRVEPTASEVRL